jgi:hypothetical protein
VTDIPNPSGDAEVPTPDSPPAADGAAWYKRPMIWIIAAVAAILIILIIVLLADGQDDDAVATTTTTVADSTTSSEPPETTEAPETTLPPETTAPPETTLPPGAEPVVVTASEIAGNEFERYQPDDDLGFDDEAVEAHWYTWDESFVVVYAGWEATEDNPLCPGNSLQLSTDFDFISNSPTFEGGCDPEADFDLTLIPIDDELGARVCGGLVIYRTKIPLVDDRGEPTTGDLYATIERSDGERYIGSTSMTSVDAESELTELDPTADAYSIPGGWLRETSLIVC